MFLMCCAGCASILTPSMKKNAGFDARMASFPAFQYSIRRSDDAFDDAILIKEVSPHEDQG